MLLSDLLLPQTFIAFPFTFLTDNMLLIFNNVFIFTFVLNYISLFLFWKQIFRKDFVSFFGALIFIFSPFVHLELGHFQMISFWPFFFTMYFILKTEKTNNKRYLLYGGIFFALQFLASVYLSVFLITSVLVYYFIRFVSTKTKKEVVIRVLILFALFISIDGIFIKGYYDMKKVLNVKRDYNEFVTYSAHISDYVFTSNIKSLLHQSPVMVWWNTFNNHTLGGGAVGIGFMFFILFISGIIYSFKRKNTYRYLFLTLISLGLIFSLGPRLSFNGKYLQYHLPYSILLKTVPFFESIRVVARWSFLFYLGIIYFSVLILDEITKKKKFSKRSVILILLFIWFAIEYLPINISSSGNNYLTKDYDELKKICSKSKKVLLEIPVTHLYTWGGLAAGVKYVNDIQLASLYHGCFIINGYSGYDLPSNLRFDMQVADLYKKNDTQGLLNLFKSTKADYVKINGNILKTKNVKSEIIQLK